MISISFMLNNHVHSTVDGHEYMIRMLRAKSFVDGHEYMISISFMLKVCCIVWVCDRYTCQYITSFTSGCYFYLSSAAKLWSYIRFGYWLECISIFSYLMSHLSIIYVHNHKWSHRPCGWIDNVTHSRCLYCRHWCRSGTNSPTLSKRQRSYVCFGILVDCFIKRSVLLPVIGL